MNDQDLAKAVNAYMKEHPHATRGELRKKIGTSDGRMERLHKLGLITKFPLTLSASAAATLSRKRNKPFQNWYISKPAPWHKGA